MIFGNDGQVRSARVRKLGRGKCENLNRPLTKLFPLEITRDNGKEEGNIETIAKKVEMRTEGTENKGDGDKISLENVSGTRSRSLRAAAKDGR